MKASDIRRGMVIDGWTVVDGYIVDLKPLSSAFGPAIVLLTLERPPYPVDPFEYRITEGGRKTWDGEPDLSKEGWEEYQEWERFDYTEERYWRRLRPGEEIQREQDARKPRQRRTWYRADETVEAEK